MATKTLVILESASKIKKIQGFLGNDYIVKASCGHIRDLKPSSLSVEIENNYKPIYDINSDKKKVVKELKDTYKTCKNIILASDLDREGEAIAFHLSEILKIKPENRNRLLFNEITKSSIQKAMKDLKLLNMNMVNAQQARRIVDRLIGYKISPMLWKHIQNSYEKKISLSAGRVQSVVLKLIIEREEEIKKHRPENYFQINGLFQHNIKAKLDSQLDDIDNTKELLNDCNTMIFTVKENIKKASSSSPPKPFITSSLQQEASNKFHMSPKQTMATAQKLYEKGYITYMRTDSYNLSDEFLDKAKEYILENYSQEYLEIKKYKTNSESSQEAHEAIRPCNIETVSIDEEPYENKLYKLIWQRTLASQMSKSKYDAYTLKISMDLYDELFISKCNKTTFDGYTRVYEVYKDNETDNEETKDSFPINIKPNTIIQYQKMNADETFTKSTKSRYTEASLIKQLDKLEIGRPSTYSNMVCVVQDRKYVEKRDVEGLTMKLVELSIEKGKKLKETIKEKKVGSEKNKLVPNSIGYIVNEFMNTHFSNIIDYTFTKNFEKELDKVSKGQLNWVKLVDDTYNSFKSLLVELQETHKEKQVNTIGIHPDTQLPIYCYVAKYGPVLKHNNTFVPLKEIKVEDMTIETALTMLKYPMKLSNEITVKKGKFGLYFSYNSKNYSLSNVDEEEINLDTCLNIVKTQDNEKGQSNVINKFGDDMTIMNGKYGPYINYKNKNYKIYGKTDPKELTKAMCMDIVKKKK